LSPSQGFDRLFNPFVSRVVLERVDGELIVVEVEFDNDKTTDFSFSSASPTGIARKSSGLGSK